SGRGWNIAMVNTFPHRRFRPLERTAIAATAGLLEAHHSACRNQARLHAVHFLRLRRIWIDDRARERRSSAAIESPRALPMVRRAGREDAVNEQLIFAHIPHAATMASSPSRVPPDVVAPHPHPILRLADFDRRDP